VRSWLAGIAALLCVVPAFAIDLQGHRGARGLAPENTLPAFQRALEIGVTTLELDVGVTRDGVVVISHDTVLNPDHTRDASGAFLDRPGPAIHALTWAELQAYDVGRLKPGTDYARGFPEQKPVDGTRIPRLADLFELVKRSGDRQVRFDIETKLNPSKPDETPSPEAFARAVVEEIRKAGMASRSTVQSFDWRTLHVVQKIAPEIPTAYLTRNNSVPKKIKADGGSIWSAYFGDLNAQLVKEAQALGLKVLAWTVNEPAMMAQIIDLGVDGLITDRPDLARKLLEERGLRWR
jgi:glycerophosphoryl diester phosphodiesterase